MNETFTIEDIKLKALGSPTEISVDTPHPKQPCRTPGRWSKAD